MAKQGKARVLTFDEFQRADRAAMSTRHSKRNRAMLYLSFGLGLRACEIRRLKVNDVLDFDGKLKEEILLEKCVTKGGKQRQVYLTNCKIKAILMDYIHAEKNKYTNFGCIKNFTNKFLFPSQKGGVFRANNIIRVFHDIFKRANLDGAKSHSGRRTFITSKIDEGVDLKAIADIVGHESILTTADYHEKNPTRLKKISENSIF